MTEGLRRRRQLEQRRDDLADRVVAHANRRDHAAAERHDRQPALVAARSAWAPYGDSFGEIEERLRRELRPALWNATV